MAVAAIPVGLLVGGLVTMIVDRAPDRTPMSFRSRCPHCETPLGLVDSIPVASWFMLRRRCRHCRVPITGAYPVVEILTALLFVAVFIRFEAEWVVIPPLVLATSLMALSVIDLFVYRLPDVVTGPAILVSLGRRGGRQGVDRCRARRGPGRRRGRGRHREPRPAPQVPRLGGRLI